MTMGGLASILVSHPPRERSGGPSANRVAYHHTWALCQLLRLHQGDQDYVLIMEFHDDVLVVDSPTNPAAAHFYQVKTRKDGKWTTTDLLEIDQPKSRRRLKTSKQTAVAPSSAPARSILGKLVDHVRHFAPHVRSLNLVSNARFNLQLAAKPASDDREEIGLVDLNERALKTVKNALKTELGLSDEPPVELLFLLVSGMSLTEHEKHGAGELAAFLDKRRPGGRYAVQALYRTLADEISRRGRHEWQPSSFDELCRKRGICRADFEALLRLAERQPDPQQLLSAATEQLRAEGLAYRELSRIEGAWQRYQVESTDHANESLATFRQGVIEAARAAGASPAWNRLTEFLTLAEEHFVKVYGEPEAPFDRNYLRGALLLEHKTIEAGQLPSSDPQPQTEAP